MLEHKKQKAHFSKTLMASLLGLAIALPAVTTTPAVAHKYELVLQNNSLIKQGRKALKKGRIDKAIQLYETALERNLSEQNLVWANNDLCVAYYLLGDYSVANDYCDEAIKLSPVNWSAHNNRANILMATGDFGKALTTYKHAQSLNPESEVLAQNIVLAQNFLDRSTEKTAETNKSENGQLDQILR